MSTATASPPKQQQGKPAETISEARSMLEQVLAQQSKPGTRSRIISDALMSRIDVVEDVLPPGLQGQAGRLIKRAMITFNRTPQLQECPPDVFIRCVIQAAEMGLAIDGKLCYVVKYKSEFQVQADFKGLVSVAKRSGQIIDCKADIVCENDEFSYSHKNGRDELEHTPAMSDRGDVTAAYASFLLPDGRCRVCVMLRDELDKVQRMAPAKNGPWASWTEEMQKKCPVRRGLKMYCDDPGIIAAMLLDDDDETPTAEAPQQSGPTLSEKLAAAAAAVRKPATGTIASNGHAPELSQEPTQQETQPPADDIEKQAAAAEANERTGAANQLLIDIPLARKTWELQIGKHYGGKTWPQMTAREQADEIARLGKMVPVEA